MPTASRTKLWLQLQSRDQRERCLSSTLNDRPRAPFLCLVRHFLDRLVRGGNDAAATEFELGIGALLGLLAAPGAFTCLLLLDKYSTLFNWLRGRLREDLYVASLPDKYLFLSLAMAVTGIVTVLKWDKILPDAQDYLNLAPLPVRPRAILLANAVAIVVAVLVFALDVNGASMILFPLFVTGAAQTTIPAFFAFLLVHAACVMLASFFTFCAVFGLLGTLAAVLPREAFRAISSWVRGMLLVAFLVLLLTGFSGPSLILRLAGGGVRFLPSFWYLGLYQSWQHRATPVLAGATAAALPGAAAAFLLMVVTYALSYRRRFAGVLEGGRRPSEQKIVGAVVAFLDLFAARASGFPRACHRFVVRALLRNEAHRLAIAVSIGLGWLLALQDISEGLEREAPLVAVYLLLLGLRVAFELPASVPSNWIFRAALDPRSNESAFVTRQVMLSFLTSFVLLPCLTFSWWRWGPAMALLHTAYVLALSLCLIEILLTGYRKVPLTCPMPGFRENLLLLCLLQVLGFEAFTHIGAGLEEEMLHEPASFLLVPSAMLAGWWWKRWRHKEALEAGEIEPGLLFENLRTRAVETLNLSE
jgi:hypothetical protein